MTTNSNAEDWFQHFYNLPNAATPPPYAAAAATNNYSFAQQGMGVTDSFMGLPSTTDPPISTNTTTTTYTPISPGPVLAQEARGGTRPARRRTRTSRKNPTTLFNTDTTNFRAMVQRYTGGNAIATTYSNSFETAPSSGFNGGGVYQGQMLNVNQLHLQQQRLMMQHHGFITTGDVSGSSARTVEEDGFSSLTYFYSADMGGNGGGVDHRTGGFMY